MYTKSKFILLAVAGALILAPSVQARETRLLDNIQDEVVEDQEGEQAQEQEDEVESVVQSGLSDVVAAAVAGVRLPEPRQEENQENDVTIDGDVTSLTSASSPVSTSAGRVYSEPAGVQSVSGGSSVQSGSSQTSGGQASSGGGRTQVSASARGGENYGVQENLGEEGAEVEGGDGGQGISNGARGPGQAIVAENLKGCKTIGPNKDEDFITQAGEQSQAHNEPPAGTVQNDYWISCGGKIGEKTDSVEALKLAQEVRSSVGWENKTNAAHSLALFEANDDGSLGTQLQGGSDLAPWPKEQSKADARFEPAPRAALAIPALTDGRTSRKLRVQCQIHGNLFAYFTQVGGLQTQGGAAPDNYQDDLSKGHQADPTAEYRMETTGPAHFMTQILFNLTKSIGGAI